MQNHWRTLAGFCIMASIAPRIAAEDQAPAGSCIDKIVPIVKQEMGASGVPGMMVEIQQNDKVLVHRGFGVTILNGAQPPDRSSIFPIGSLSKALTGVGVLNAAGDNKLDVKDLVSKYLPDVPTAWKNIPLNRFLSHGSGIPKVEDKEESFDGRLRLQQGVAMAFSPPGSATRYNNFNYAVMGKVLEKASGQSYIAYMNKNVFARASMRSTGTAPQSDAARRVTGYILKGGKLTAVNSAWLNQTNDDYGIPSGGLVSTSADLTALAVKLNRGTLLPPRAQQLLFAPVALLPQAKAGSTLYTNGGFIYTDVQGTEVFHKTGGGTGVGSGAVMMLVPKQQISIVILRNLFAKSQTSNGILAGKMLKACFGIAMPQTEDEPE